MSVLEPLDFEVHGKLLDLPTADVSDALMELGVEPRIMDCGIRPMVPYSNLVGRAFTVRYEAAPRPLDGTPLVGSGIMDCLETFRRSNRGSHWVMVSEPSDPTIGTVGDGLAAIGRTIGVTGFVTDGAARDSHEARHAGVPIFSRGLSPRGPYNSLRVEAADTRVHVGGVTVDPGDVVAADNDGLVVFDFELCDDVVRAALKIQLSHASPRSGPVHNP